MKTAETKIPAEPVCSKMYLVEPSRLSIRKNPSMDAEIVKILNHGDSVERIGEDDGTWMRVRGGYVMSEFLATAG